MTEQQLREEMVQIGASLFSRGYATGSAGNLSLLLPDGNLLATPTGSCLGELQAQRLSVVTLQGGMDLRRQTVERGHFSPGSLFALTRPARRSSTCTATI